MAIHKHNPYRNACYTYNDLSNLVIQREQQLKIHIENLTKSLMSGNLTSAKANSLFDEYCRTYNDLLKIKDAQT